MRIDFNEEVKTHMQNTNTFTDRGMADSVDDSKTGSHTILSKYRPYNNKVKPVQQKVFRPFLRQEGKRVAKQEY